MLIKTIEELTHYFNECGDTFTVNNGNWIGKIISKNTNGIIINMYNADKNDFLMLMTTYPKRKMKLMREQVFFAYTYECNWYIDIKE